MKWFNTLSHNRWLEQETDRIFNFGKNAAVPTGFGWLGNSGQVRADMGTHLWITARMLHVYSVAASMGRPVHINWSTTALSPERRAARQTLRRLVRLRE
jgi:sulfoquinovose isomerase